MNEAQYLVENIVRARVDHLHHHVGMEKVRGDHIWYEGSVFFLEHNGHYVVAYVPLSLQLQQQQSSSQIVNRLDKLRLHKTHIRKRRHSEFISTQSYLVIVICRTYRVNVQRV